MASFLVEYGPPGTGDCIGVIVEEANNADEALHKANKHLSGEGFNAKAVRKINNVNTVGLH